MQSESVNTYYYNGDKTNFKRSLSEWIVPEDKWLSAYQVLSKIPINLSESSVRKHACLLWRKHLNLNNEKRRLLSLGCLYLLVPGGVSSGTTVQVADITCIKKGKNAYHGFSGLLGHPHQWQLSSNLSLPHREELKHPRPSLEQSHQKSEPRTEHNVKNMWKILPEISLPTKWFSICLASS